MERCSLQVAACTAVNSTQGWSKWSSRLFFVCLLAFQTSAALSYFGWCFIKKTFYICRVIDWSEFCLQLCYQTLVVTWRVCWSPEPEQGPAGTELTPCMFHLIPLSPGKVCVCVSTAVSVPSLGKLYFQGSVTASRPPSSPTVDTACHQGISIAHRHAACSGLPDPLMKAFRCLETYQLRIPELRSDEDCLCHSHDKRSMSAVSA